MHYVTNCRHPLSSIRNHGLIKLLVQRYLSQNNLTWEHFVGVGVHQEPAIAHIGDRVVEQSYLGSARGRDEELEEGEDEQEENLGGVVAVQNPMEEMVEGTMVIEVSIPLPTEGGTLEQLHKK